MQRCLCRETSVLTELFQGKPETATLRTLKEVVCFKHPNVVHIYNVIEHGRRWFRSLVFTSDTRYCLQELQPSLVDQQSAGCYTSGLLFAVYPCIKPFL